MCVGAALIYQAVRVGGTIEAHTAFMFGRIDKGSAGLIIAFLGSTIVISCLAFGDVDEQGQKKKISSFLWG